MSDSSANSSGCLSAAAFVEDVKVIGGDGYIDDRDICYRIKRISGAARGLRVECVAPAGSITVKNIRGNSQRVAIQFALELWPGGRGMIVENERSGYYDDEEETGALCPWCDSWVYYDEEGDRISGDCPHAAGLSDSCESVYFVGPVATLNRG